jgi:putative aldouronate transport system substrate-binding protein
MRTRYTPTGLSGVGSQSVVHRRAFLRMVSAAGVAFSIGLSACTPRSETNTAVPTTTPRPASPQSANKPRLPAQIATQGARPDLPPSNEGLQAGYFTYPKELVKSVSQAPGTGGDVIAVSLITTAPPPPLDQNPAWQAINKQLNVNLRLQLVPNADYYAKVPAIIAGNDLPDLFYLDTTQLAIDGLPQFLKASHTDLSPFLAGDGVKDYPNLAGFPTVAWKQVLYDNAIYGIPVVRPYFQYVWYVNQNQLDAIGAKQPRSGEEFKRMLVELTRPQSNQYGIGALSPTYGLIYTGRGDSPQTAMFGVPNNWAVDSKGAFTKDIETEQFKAALGYVRDLYAAGVFYPDPSLNNTTLKANFLAGKFAIAAAGWNSYQSQLWDVGLRQTPPFKVRTLHPFSNDGGKPIFHQSQSFIGMAAVKKGTPERVKELLRILNYLASPFGSQEHQLINYGVKEQDFTLDAKGTPVPTQTGLLDVNLGLPYLATAMPVLFDPIDPEFVKVAYADEQAMVDVLISDPSIGLYSNVDRTKGGGLMRRFADSLGEIIRGSAPLSNLSQLVKDWQTAGGDQMRQEFQQAYESSQ